MTGWSFAEDARLRALWAGTLSAAQIGREMGRGKNSIVGRVHRLGLPARPSPIGAPARPKAERPKAERPARVRPIRSPLAAPPKPAAMPPAAPRGVTHHRKCQWIEGPARGEQSRFCGAPAKEGLSWCQMHASRVFVARVA